MAALLQDARIPLKKIAVPNPAFGTWLPCYQPIYLNTSLAASLPASPRVRAPDATGELRLCASAGEQEQAHAARAPASRAALK
eukprot:2696064-Rhodomonas_salina.1